MLLRLLEALAAAAPGLTALDLDGTGAILMEDGFSAIFVDIVLARMRGLQSIAVDLCTVDLLRSMVALPGLQARRHFSRNLIKLRKYNAFSYIVT